MNISYHKTETQSKEHSATYPEVWGGLECTVNRLDDIYLDQVKLTGHSKRINDLTLFAGLGIKTIRYPILWERVFKTGKADWSWTDRRLEKLKELNITPIAGLVHHGSGPKETNLIDPHFPDKLAEFAAAVASRYPWIDNYTPINEPLTTARFSCLYGHWYPHYRDSFAFARSLLIQCRGIVQSMKAIKMINPKAKLIETEDLGKTYSTPHLTYQADFENTRRWLTFDLLCGYVNKHHPMWDHFISLGIDESELQYFLDEPYPPDVIGVNYYITSQRYLDENTELYPKHTHGGNGSDTYADVEAVRVQDSGFEDVKVLLKEVWNRYKLPIAITEVHLHCTRDEQLRWLHDKWNAAVQLNSENVPIVAVTAWALLGSMDWNSLLTKPEGIYEPGVFDVRGAKPRPTILSKYLRSISSNEKFDHPILKTEGWWKRDNRIIYGVSDGYINNSTNNNASPILITGATGTLGKAFARVCEQRGLKYVSTTRQEMNIADEKEVRRVIKELKPWAVINTAGYVNVDKAESEHDICFRENTYGAMTLANICAENGIRYAAFSSDLVFDGQSRSPYKETDDTNPLNIYGKSKAEAEKLILSSYDESLIIRTSAFFGPWDEYNFLTQSMNMIASGIPVNAAKDLTISPTYVPDLVNNVLDLLLDEEKGIWHLANQGSATWSELLHLALELSDMSNELVFPTHSKDIGFTAERPRYSVLGSDRGEIMPDLINAIERYCREKVFVPMLM